MESLMTWVQRRLWSADEPARPWRRRLRILARYLFALGRDLATGDVNLRAMSLVYTTMLAVVPTLGFAFAVAKALGFHRQLEAPLLRALEPIGPQAEDITARIIGFAENIHGGVLGILSLALLLVTVLSMAKKVESSFNFVWRVDRPRSLARRFSEYLSVILIGPTIMLAAITLIASLSNTQIVDDLQGVPVIGALVVWFGDLLPYLMIAAAFTALYMFIPNTRVRFVPAVIGGIAGGLVWATSGFLFTTLVVSSAQMQSIYSGFAILLILMFWLYISWLVLLFGSLLAFYVQNPFHLRYGQRTEPIDNDARERLCLSVMYLIASDFAQPAHGWTNESLAAVLRVPRSAIEPIMAALGTAGLVVRASEQRLVPGKDPHRISLTEILAAVRGRKRSHVELGTEWSQSIDTIVDRIDVVIDTELGQRSLGALVDQHLPKD